MKIESKNELKIGSTISFAKVNADSPGTRPSNVIGSQINISAPGELYWGDKTHINSVANNSPSFTANGFDLAFDGSIGTIVIGDGVVLKAGN